MNLFQETFHVLAVGKGQTFIRLILLMIAVSVVGLLYDFETQIIPFTTFTLGGVYHGLDDPQSMDNAQLARQIFRGQGFTTEFLRPYALTQIHDWRQRTSSHTGQRSDLFPLDLYPPGALRTLPDTYNAPGYPSLLAAWFHVVHPEFDETPDALRSARLYSGDIWIPILNQIFLLMTAFLVFVLGLRLFDERIAWFSLLAFLGTDLVWRFSITALSTTFLMFLITAVMICALEIFQVGENCFKSEVRSFVPAWLWTLALSLLLAVACLTRLPLAVLLLPLFIFLMMMPRANLVMPLLIIMMVAPCLGAWFFHMYKVSGNPLGSNETLLLLGGGDYGGNQIFCSSSIPPYEKFFKEVGGKELAGFRYNFEHAWSLLGSNPLILLFGVSILHKFRRRRIWYFQWLLFICAIILVAANNLGFALPETVGPWNILPVLFPCMLVMGTAYFFILLDRLDIQIALLTTILFSAMMLLTIFPLALTVIGVNARSPGISYFPALIKILGTDAETDEWVTTDMPWATAWYADRASLWLPDSVADFESLHNTVCPTGILILTPVSWAMPFDTFKTGEYKEWLPFANELPVPTDFPLSAHSHTPDGTYSVWSDRPRWQGK
jgi:4-amino-4-deoxy-L-arabinose transferase-like glycosyltransferase